jgi:uncharacterized protein YdeI (YjbR/CyaY-like superfamily)
LIIGAAGPAKVAEAIENSEWDAAAERERVDEIPADLEQALKQQEPVWEAYERWPASRKEQYLY